MVVMIGSLMLYCLLFGFSNVTATSKRSTTFYRADSYQEKDYWLWECQRGNCVRVASSYTSDKSANNFTSIDECRLVCLPFSTVWPQPTGTFKISREVQMVDLDRISFNLDKVVGNNGQEFINKNAMDVFMHSVATLCSSASRLDENSEEWKDLRQNIPLSPVKITVSTKTKDTKLDYNTDESYLLVINNTESGIDVDIGAVTVFGARHGLQTLSQLFACRKGLVNILVIMSDAKISDKPVYPHRGLLVDTARTFLSLDAILRTLDGMAASKLNVFHWHATDSHSFPLYSEAVPNLSRYGAYSPKEMYMPEDVKAIIEYANLRGIRIILEIDAPSHAGFGWQWGQKEGLGNLALCVDAQPWHKYCIQPPCGQLNPLNLHVYSILKSLYADIQERFQPDIFHMGGDEVFFPCWLSDIPILQWLKESGWNDTSEGLLELWSMFQYRSLLAWDQADNKTEKIPIILWSSQLTDPKHIDKYLDPQRYIIEMWTEKTDDAPLELLSKGYKVIMATKDAWYLDHGFWGSTTYHKWNDVYENTIYEPSIGVYGGEACLWGEYVSESNLDSRLWPRAACVAERLWSNPERSASAALPRLLDHTDRLMKLHIKPDMIAPEWCRQNDGKC